MENFAIFLKYRHPNIGHKIQHLQKMQQIDFSAYQYEGFFDEMFGSNSQVRPGFDVLMQKMESMSSQKMLQLQYASDRAQRSIGMTFNVYSDQQGTERILPLDLIPRIIPQEDWEHI